MKSDFLNILIIDDEASMRHMLRLVLEQRGYRITEAGNGREGLTLLKKERFDAVLCDLRMAEMDGLSFLKQTSVKNSPATIIMMSAYGSIDTAIECLKLGAYDYISKPFKPDEVLLTLKKAAERQLLQRENLRLKKALATEKHHGSAADIITSNSDMLDILESVRKVATSDAAVLIQGETGTGKELIAQALHTESNRRTGPFLAINCAAISAGLLESELFGHVKGAFTGADQNKEGIFQAANGGTLFLDEISELPLELQPKLLRVLQEGEIRPVGATQSLPINTRVVAASGIDFKQAVVDNRFRDDLYYRLAVIDFKLPPLRQRQEDISLLANHFLYEIATREDLPVPQLDSLSITRLQSYYWPGNIRELKNYLEKAMIFSRHGKLELPPLPAEQRQQIRPTIEEFSLKKAAQRLEKEYIHKALDQTDGNRTQAAKMLEISLRSLMYKIKEYNIE